MPDTYIRTKRILTLVNSDGRGIRQEVCESINAAKRQSRVLQGNGATVQRADKVPPMVKDEQT